MKESLAEKQATEVVMHHEIEVINMLFQELEASKIRQEKCGCPNCKKHVEAIESMLQKELERISPEI